MSSLYWPVLVLHVLVAVLGLGSTASVAIVATTARKTGRGATDVVAAVRPLLRYSALSLAAMLVTGLLLDLAMNGAFHNWWWFRASVLLLVVTGALHGQASRAVRSELVSNDRTDAVLRKVERLSYTSCALIGMITVLMELKPF